MGKTILITGASSGIGKATLRYRAGDDANFLLDNRKKMEEDAFVHMIKEQYGLREKL